MAIEKPITETRPAQAIEASSIIHGYSLAQHVGLSSTLESYCLDVVQKVNRQKDMSPFGLLIHQIRQTKNIFLQTQICKVNRKANFVADRLAKLGLTMLTLHVWMKTVPHHLYPRILKDNESSH